MTTTNFPKLTAVTVTDKGTKFVYTGTFADGSTKVIRTSAKAAAYVSVAHVIRDHKEYRNGAYYCPPHTTEDFVFGGKAQPTVSKFQRNWVAAIVQIAVA